MAAKKKQQLTVEEKMQQALVPQEEQPYKIPANWCWTYIKDVSNVITGKTPNKKNKEYYGETFPFFKPADLDMGRSVFAASEYLSESGKKISTKIPKNSTLICCIGTIGKSGYLLVDGTTNQQINSLIPKINPLFLYYYTNTERFVQELKLKASATTIAIVNKSKTETCTFPLAPLNEQQRIVNVIESLFAKLDEAKQLIQNTIDKFEQNKMAILHKAFSGELTAKWREENNIDLSSWENQSINEVCEINPKKVDTKKLDDNLSVSFIPMPCVSDILGKITSMEIRNLVEVKKGYTNFSEGDILFAKITPCMENGKSAIVGKLENDIGFGSTEFHVLRCDTDKINNKFLHYFVRQRKFRDEAKAQMTGAVGQQRVPKIFIEDYKINLPIIEEQQAIVNILDKVFIKYDKIKDLQAQIDKIELLKKSILAKAFRGELGTNDPNEESAEVLLREILAGR
ncbi:restriction endonuclease subunit S [Megamonas hypermegale]|uniref:restriction endonuclease subunit S n=1 Tax=Megamonas hypermegale TaxID=158847 RepID=UPI0026F119F0|nr:restriction endonuclease subunit S [Megamonas hypermegale]